MYLKGICLLPRKAPCHCYYNMYIVAIAKLMDPNKSLVNFGCNILSIDLVIQMNFVSDIIILIFSQSNVNITIDTKITSKYYFAYFKRNKID